MSEYNKYYVKNLSSKFLVTIIIMFYLTKNK